MPTITYTFTLPDERDTYEIYQQAERLQSIVEALAAEWRSHRKYGAPAPTEESFYACLEAYGVTLS